MYLVLPGCKDFMDEFQIFIKFLQEGINECVLKIYQIDSVLYF